MKRFLIIYILILPIFVILPAFADDIDNSGGIEDILKYSNFVENGFEGQKKITDEDFQKTLDSVKAKQNKKNKINKPFKGQGFNNENNSNYLGETAEKNLLLSIPLELINGDGVEIPVGHYKIIGEKTSDKIFLDFYQASTLVAKVPAIETDTDFDESGINFVKLIPYNEERVKIIYGSMDFNAYTFIKIKNKISDLN